LGRDEIPQPSNRSRAEGAEIRRSRRQRICHLVYAGFHQRLNPAVCAATHHRPMLERFDWHKIFLQLNEIDNNEKVNYSMECVKEFDKIPTIKIFDKEV